MKDNKIEVGDKVLAVSMGLVVRQYKAIEINDGVVKYDSTTLTTTDEIKDNGYIEVITKDSAVNHINCVEYRFVTPELKRALDNTELIGAARGMLYSISELLSKVDTKGDCSGIEKYIITIENLYNDIKEDKTLWQQ